MAKQGAVTATPRLRFPEFRGAAGWEEKPLVSACERITQGGTPDTSNPEYWDGDVAWLTPAEMGKSDDPKVASTVRRITQDGLRACSSELLPVESVIISTRAPIGHLAINTVPMAINQGCKGLVSGASLDHRFLLSSLSGAKSRLIDLGAGNTFKELSASALKAFVIPVPLPDEQQKIADCLTSLDEVIAAQGRKVEALKAHKRGLMQQLFPREGETHPRLRFPEFRDAPEWTIVPLGKLLEGKPEYGVNAPAVPFSPNLPSYLRITDIDTDGRFVSAGKVSVGIDVTEENYLSIGDIALARTGASVGKSYFYREEDGRLVFAGFLIRIRPNRKKAVPSFVSSFLTTQQYWNWVQVTSARSGQPGINGSEYAALPIPIPPSGGNGEELAEQQRIADFLSALDAQIAAESSRLTALKTHKQGLMQQLFPAPEAVHA